jgi:hypothetical protein
MVNTGESFADNFMFLGTKHVRYECCITIHDARCPWRPRGSFGLAPAIRRPRRSPRPHTLSLILTPIRHPAPLHYFVHLAQLLSTRQLIIPLLLNILRRRSPLLQLPAHISSPLTSAFSYRGRSIWVDTHCY